MRDRCRLFGSPRISYVVFASPKSGTQWIQQLLSAHPDVQCAETRAFGPSPDPPDSRGTEPGMTLEGYVSMLGRYHRPPAAAAADYFRGLVFNLWDAIAQTSLGASGKSIYGEKVTAFRGTAVAVIQRLVEYNPDLRFVHLTRDGRDVVVSGLVHQQIIHARSPGCTTLSEAVAASRVPQDFLQLACTVWEEAVEAGLQGQDRFAHALGIRYEDVIEDTAGQVRRLLEFIGAESSDVEHCVEAASFERMSGGRRRGEEDRSSVVRKGVPGDWRNWFTDEQVAWFDEQAGPLLERLGYERMTVAL